MKWLLILYATGGTSGAALMQVPFTSVEACDLALTSAMVSGLDSAGQPHVTGSCVKDFESSRVPTQQEISAPVLKRMEELHALIKKQAMASGHEAVKP